MKNILISTTIFFLVLAGAGCEYHEYQTIQAREPQQPVSEGTSESSESEVIQPSAEEGQNTAPGESEELPSEEPSPEEPPVDEGEDGPPTPGQVEIPTFSSPIIPNFTQTDGPTYSPPGSGATPAEPPCDGSNFFEWAQCLTESYSSRF